MGVVYRLSHFPSHPFHVGHITVLFSLSFKDKKKKISFFFLSIFFH